MPSFPYSRALYRTLLLALPADVRAEVGGDMESLFLACVARYRRKRGRLGHAIAVARGAADAMAFAVVVRRTIGQDRQLHFIQHGITPEGPMKRLAGFALTLLQDARFAARLLFKDRSFTITALLTLAICIGANAAIFSVVRSVVLKPLPVAGADRIVMFHNNYPNAGAVRGSTGVPDYYDRQTQMDVAEEYALYRRQGATLGATDGARRLVTLVATPSFFRLTSLTPALGRIFTNDEGEDGKDSEALLSYGLWQREFGGAGDVVGKDVVLSGTTYRIVGVAPKDFTFLWNDIDVYLPAAFDAREKSDERRHSNNWEMIALLKPGRTLAQAQEQLNAINLRNESRFPALTKILHDAGFYTAVADLQGEIVQDVKPVLMLLWGGVVFVLLIGCLNIANLVLVRASGRTREMATRHAIGADKTRLARQMLTETTLLSLTGGVVGLGVGWSALRLAPSIWLDQIPRGFEIALDPFSAAVVVGAALVVGLLIGLVPVARLSGLNINNALREEGRGGTAGRSTNLLRRGLAVAQVTIAFVLLIGAGLLLASFRQVLKIDTGFSPAGVITGAITLPGAAYKDEMLAPFSDRLLTSVRQLPGVEAAAVASSVPLSGNHSDNVILAEGYVMQPGESLVSPTQFTVSDGYFEAMKIGLVRGRYFTASDTKDSTLAVVVDEKLANHFWPGRDPIGRRLYQPSSAENVFKTGPDTKWLTVVGVVKEVQSEGIATEQPSVGAYYNNYAQQPTNGIGLVVLTARPTGAIVPELRRALAGIDPALPLYRVQSMAEYVDDALMPRRMPMLLAIAFGGVALFLSAIGIYGVLAYGVSQRRREIGIRLALGSTAGQVFGLVLRDGIMIVCLGLALGFAGLVALRQVLVNVLFGVTPMDPMVILSVALGLALVALVAMVLPARRAAAVDPASALQNS
jgi:predicted permease